MAFNPYVGVSQVQLEAWLASARSELAVGSQIHTTGSADVTSGRQIQAGPMARISQLLLALNALDPTTYPADQVFAPTRTVATMGASY